MPRAPKLPPRPRKAEPAHPTWPQSPPCTCRCPCGKVHRMVTPPCLVPQPPLATSTMREDQAPMSVECANDGHTLGCHAQAKAEREVLA